MATYIGKQLLQFDEIDSTQNYAKDICLEAASGTIVMADCQTQGRGRLNRSWSSEPGLGIWMSIILKPNIVAADFPKLTLVVAVALQETFDSFGAKSKIKWPNDILIDGKKISGVLTEMVAKETVIVGCGINVNHVIEDFPIALREKASSLRRCLNRELDRSEIYLKFFDKLESYLRIFESEGFEPIRLKWLENSDSLGKDVEVVMGSSNLRGTIFGIDANGVLLVEDENCDLHRVISGDVIYLG